jgi:hypothetical protein
VTIADPVAAFGKSAARLSFQFNLKVLMRQSKGLF